jgi:hypothetical protein
MSEEWNYSSDGQTRARAGSDQDSTVHQVLKRCPGCGTPSWVFPSDVLRPQDCPTCRQPIAPVAMPAWPRAYTLFAVAGILAFAAVCVYMRRMHHVVAGLAFFATGVWALLSVFTILAFVLLKRQANAKQATYRAELHDYERWLESRLPH